MKILLEPPIGNFENSNNLMTKSILGDTAQTRRMGYKRKGLATQTAEVFALRFSYHLSP
jgi:hypothetical protein